MSIAHPDDMDPTDFPFVEFDNDIIYTLMEFFYTFSPNLNIIAQSINIFENLIHLSVLTRKTLRTNAVFVFMIIICLSDNIQFLCSFGNFPRQENWVITFKKDLKMTKCAKKKWVVLDPNEQIFTFIVGVFRRFSAWIAILMALIRMLSVMLPMNNLISKMGKPMGAIVASTIVLVVCMLIDLWPVVFIRVAWYPDVMRRNNKNCNPSAPANQHIVLLVAEAHVEVLVPFCVFEIIIRFIQSSFYPLITVALLLQLRIIKKQRISLRQDSQNQSLTKLILFMTVSFMLAEGLVGFFGLILYKSGVTGEWDIGWLVYAGTANYIIINLRALNALSHAFVCFFMSSQYRDTMKVIFCQNRVSREVIKKLKIENLFVKDSAVNSGVIQPTFRSL
ncbi:unnamed protein product [Caenorhabditis brenneri]